MKDLNKNFTYGILMIILIMMASVIYTAKSNFAILRENTIARSLQFQDQRIDNVVSTMNRVQTFLDKTAMKTPEKITMYETTLFSLTHEIKMYQTGGSILLDENLNYLVDDNPIFTYRGNINDYNFGDIASNPQKYGSLPGNIDLKKCYDQIKSGNESGSCINKWTDDTEYYYWHRIPNLGVEANNKHYFFIFGFKESEALNYIYEYNSSRLISMAVQTLFVIISVFIAIWAIKNRDHIRKKYEGGN